MRQLELVGMPPRTPVRRPSRRDLVKPGKLKLCGTCKGRGASLGSLYQWSAALFDVWWHDGIDYRGPIQFRSPNLVCHHCRGSGLNATAKRAWELEIACRREVSR